MKKFLLCLMLVGIMGGLAACTEEEEGKKAADASFACLGLMLPAAQTCVNACLPAPVSAEEKLACEKTCVDSLVGQAGAMCGEEFGTVYKSEQFGAAIGILVKSAVALYDALRIQTDRVACPPCECAVPPVAEGPVDTQPAPVETAAPNNAVLPVPASTT